MTLASRFFDGNIMDSVIDFAALILDWIIFIAGPCLISLATGLIAFVVYTGFGTLLPAKAAFLSWQWCAYVFTGIFLVVNIIFNYFMCVTTNPGTHDSPAYLRLVDDARGCGKILNRHEEDSSCSGDGDEEEEDDEDEDDSTRLTKRSGTNSGSSSISSSSRNDRKKGSWMDLAPDEWGWCKKCNMPKAPRSHYCHVTKKLVLNMDHYCPWMFNCVGWLNYRYFVLFLFYMNVGCIFAAACAAEAFFNPRMVFAGGRAARTNVSFMFILCLSVGVATFVLFAWHVFLVLSGQTTIEFYGNMTRYRRSRHRGEYFTNPYDNGWKKNFQHVFGTAPFLLALLPSDREPPGKPWPEKIQARLSRVCETVV
eukprot:g4014.t1